MVPAGYTLAKHSYHGIVPWIVLCQPQCMFFYTPPAMHNLFAHNITQYNTAKYNIINPKQLKTPLRIIDISPCKPTGKPKDICKAGHFTIYVWLQGDYLPSRTWHSLMTV